jgi:hypothetical protein
MPSPPDFAPEASSPQAHLEADPHTTRTARIPSQGRRVKVVAADPPAFDRPTGPTGFRPAGRHVRHIEPAHTEPVASSPKSIGSESMEAAGPRHADLAAGAHLRPELLRPELRQDRGPRYDTRLRIPQVHSDPPPHQVPGTPDTGPGRRVDDILLDVGLGDEDLTDAESAGRHRLPVSSVRPAVAAVLSGLLYVLTAGRAGNPDARRTLGRPRLFRRRGAA